MGQKVCPIGFRLVRNKKWRSIWYANKGEYGDLLIEDYMIRKHLKKKSSCEGTSKVEIRRMSEKIEVTIHTARPGLVIGKKGSEIDMLKKELSRLTKKEVWIEVEEIKRPDLDAELVAEGIAKQIARRMAYRRVLKKAIQSTKDAGAHGIKVQISGRLGGAEIARSEWYKEGAIPLHTIKAEIDYATVRSETTYGTIGIKVWIHRGEEILAEKGGK